MKVVYIAGKYRSDCINGIYENIQKSREIAIKLWKLGYVPISPHLNTQFMDGIIPNDDFLDGDLEIIKRCDFVVVIDNWKDSIGAKEEVKLAKRLNIPVYKFNKKGELESL